MLVTTVIQLQSHSLPTPLIPPLPLSLPDAAVAASDGVPALLPPFSVAVG